VPGVVDGCSSIGGGGKLLETWSLGLMAVAAGVAAAAVTIGDCCWWRGRGRGSADDGWSVEGDRTPTWSWCACFDEENPPKADEKDVVNDDDAVWESEGCALGMGLSPNSPPCVASVSNAMVSLLPFAAWELLLELAPAKWDAAEKSAEAAEDAAAAVAAA